MEGCCCMNFLFFPPPQEKTHWPVVSGHHRPVLLCAVCPFLRKGHRTLLSHLLFSSFVNGKPFPYSSTGNLFLIRQRETFSLFVNGREILLAHSAQWTHPVVRNVLKGGARGYAAFGVANCGVVDPSAHITYILFHKPFLLFK